MSSLSPPYIPPPTRRRNSLPANNKPNVPVRTPKSSTESYTPSSSTTSQGLAGSMSSVGGSDVFEEDLFERKYLEDMPESSETPRPSVDKNGVGKNDAGRSTETLKESPGGAPAGGKSYAAALLNAVSIKSPTLPINGVRKDALALPLAGNEKEKRKTNNNKPPAISLETLTSPTKNCDDSLRSPSALDNHRKPSTATTVWNNGLHPSISIIESSPTSPISPSTRRMSIQSITSNSPKKSTRLGSTVKADSHRASIVSIPEPVNTEPSPLPAKKNRKRKHPKKKESNSTISSVVVVPNGISNCRQSITTNA